MFQKVFYLILSFGLIKCDTYNATEAVFEDCVQLSPEKASQRWPSNWNYTCPTPSPIRLDTNTSRCYISETPLNSNLTMNDTITMLNTGFDLETFPSADINTFITGGVLGDDVYRYVKGRFIWNSNISQPAASVVDGIGAPLEVIIIFYNQKYKSFNESLRHRDGLVIRSIRVAVKNATDNPAFDEFGSYLAEIQEAGSSVRLPVSALIKWFAVFPTYPYYYSYLGSYTNFANGRQLYCATIIIDALPQGPFHISVRQFNLFRRLHNQKGVPYSNALAIFPRLGRSIVVTGPTVTHAFNSS